MRSLLLTPRWLGIHLLALLVLAGCAGLGTWQYVRAQEPERDMVTNPVEDLDRARDVGDVLDPGEYLPIDLANEAVRATGTFDADSQLLAPALSPEGDEGYYVIAPLVTENGAAVTVSRGWLPRNEAESAERLPAPPEGTVTVEGWLAPPQQENTRGFSAVSMPSGQVERIASALLVNKWPYLLYEGYVTQGRQSVPAADAGGAPALREIPPPEPPTEVRWNLKNVSYAAQWWVFGIAAVVFWGSLVRRELADRRTAASPAPPPAGTEGDADGAHDADGPRAQPSTVPAGTD